MSLTSIVSPNMSRTRQVAKRVVRSTGGIVVAQNRAAAAIGARVLRDGGSAIDAAIATSFAIGVLEPWMSGIGGIGGMVVRLPDGTTTAIDAGAVSPQALRVADFPVEPGSDGDLFGWPNVVENRNTTGAKAICAPALLAGLAQAHARFGVRDWASLVMPAVDLAQAGAVVDHHTTLLVATEMRRLSQDPGCRAWFLENGTPPLAAAAVTGNATRLRAPVLAQTLARIAREGAAALYAGPVAQALVEDIRAAGGYLDAQDLAAVAPRVGAAASMRYRDYTLHMMPELNGALSVGAAMRHCEAALDRPAVPAHRGGETSGTPDAQAVLAYTDALLAAWAQRFAQMGDGGDRTMPTCTTHISVVDRHGMMVSLTQTLLSSFGAAWVSPRTGILMNNGVNWFDPRADRPNALGAGRRALANFAPAIFSSGDDAIAIGGSGGRKIIPAVFQVLARLADFGGGLAEAIDGPRVDVSAPPLVVADERLDAAILARLGERHRTVVASRVETPNHFTIIGAVRRRAGVNEGSTEPHHVWADAVSEDEMAPDRASDANPERGHP